MRSAQSTHDSKFFFSSSVAREQKYKHRRVGGVVEVFLFVTPLCRSPALVKKSPLNLSLEYKQLKKLTFSAVVFSPKYIRIQTASCNISLVCLACTVQSLLLDFVAFVAFGCLGSGRGES